MEPRWDEEDDEVYKREEGRGVDDEFAKLAGWQPSGKWGARAWDWLEEAGFMSRPTPPIKPSLSACTTHLCPSESISLLF